MFTTVNIRFRITVGNLIDDYSIDICTAKLRTTIIILIIIDVDGVAKSISPCTKYPLEP